MSYYTEDAGSGPHSNAWETLCFNRSSGKYIRLPGSRGMLGAAALLGSKTTDTEK